MSSQINPKLSVCQKEPTLKGCPNLPNTLQQQQQRKPEKNQEQKRY